MCAVTTPTIQPIPTVHFQRCFAETIALLEGFVPHKKCVEQRRDSQHGHTDQSIGELLDQSDQNQGQTDGQEEDGHNEGSAHGTGLDGKGAEPDEEQGADGEAPLEPLGKTHGHHQLVGGAEEGEDEGQKDLIGKRID